jgi:hypothetical protein
LRARRGCHAFSACTSVGAAAAAYVSLLLLGLCHNQHDS